MLQFRILGPVEVENDDGLLELGAGRERSLLAVLLLRANEIVATDSLLHALWGDQQPRRAVASLQNGISNLRKLLGVSLIETRAPGYRLRVTPQQLDVVQFDELLKRARGEPAEKRAQTLAAALALWRGEPLADLTFESFAQDEIRRLADRRLVARVERIEAELDCGRHAHGEPAPRHALRGDLIEQPVLGLGRQISQQPLGDPCGALVGSKPASRSAAGQSSRKSTATVRRSAVGWTPSPDSVADLNSITCGWSTSNTVVPAATAAGRAGVQTCGQDDGLPDACGGGGIEEVVEEPGANGHRVGEVHRAGCRFLVQLSGVQFAAGQPGKEVDAHRPDQRLGEGVAGYRTRAVRIPGGNGPRRGNHGGRQTDAGRQVPRVALVPCAAHLGHQMLPKTSSVI